jgi:hypothetical protein
MFCKKKNTPALIFGNIAGEMGKGLMAGAAGTLAITLSQMIEMKITKREPSKAPAEAAEKVLDILPEDENKFSQEVHWAYGTSWGLPRGIMGLLGLKGLPATAIHFATIYTSALLVPTSLEVAPPLEEWSVKEFAIDALHHAVYAIAAGLVYDAMSED